MLRASMAVMLCLPVLAACSDDKAPAARPSSGVSASVASGSDAALARSMARVLAEGLQHGSNGRISSTQADCLVNEIAARVRSDALADVASKQPDAKTLPGEVRSAFGAAFDRCLSPDLAKQYRQAFGL